MQMTLPAQLLLVWLVTIENCRAAQTVAIPANPVESAAANCHDGGVSADGRFVVFIAPSPLIPGREHPAMTAMPITSEIVILCIIDF